VSLFIRLHFHCFPTLVYLDTWLWYPLQTNSARHNGRPIREGFVGQIVRFITKGRFLKYSEEKDGFLCPNCYTQRPPAPSHFGETVEVAEKVGSPTSLGSLSSPTTLADSDLMDEADKTRTVESLDAEALRRVTSRVEMEKVTTRRNLERGHAAATQR
jgi:MFS transporter, DHA1 family, multidrug resistance protein